MKVNNSTIYFNLSCKRAKDGSRLTLQTVPYWSLYRRKGDYVGPGWKRPVALTYEQVISYLKHYPGRRVLTAYPRFSKTTRNTYTVACMPDSQYIDIIVKDTGELVAQFDRNSWQPVYLADSIKHRRKEFLVKAAYAALQREGI